MIDEIDRNILKIIQTNSKATNSEIARKLDMTPSAVLERIKKLKEKGIIRRFETRLNPNTPGFALTSFILIKTNEKIGSTEIGRKIALLSHVQEVHFITGEYCYLLKVYVKDTLGLTQLMEKIGSIKGVTSSKTSLVLQPIKESLELDIDDV